VVARNTAPRMPDGPGVVIEEVVGLPSNHVTPTGHWVTLGDLSEGEQRDVILRLSIAGRRPGSLVEILDTRVEFDAVAAQGGRLADRAFTSARATDDPKELAQGKDADIERSAARVRGAAKIVKACALTRAGR